MKFLLTIFNVIVLILNLYIIGFLSGIQDYKINGELSKTYSYFMLDIPIKKFYNSIEGQNVIIEKGSNTIVKEKNYMITKDTILSGIFEIEKNGQLQKRPFNNLSIEELYNSQKDLSSILVTDFGKEKINEQIKLTKQLLQNVMQGDYITGNYQEVF